MPLAARFASNIYKEADTTDHFSAISRKGWEASPLFLSFSWTRYRNIFFYIELSIFFWVWDGAFRIYILLLLRLWYLICNLENFIRINFQYVSRELAPVSLCIKLSYTCAVTHTRLPSSLKWGAGMTWLDDKSNVGSFGAISGGEKCTTASNSCVRPD